MRDTPLSTGKTKSVLDAQLFVSTSKTRTAGLSESQIRSKINDLRASIDYQNASASAKRWWRLLENERHASTIWLAEQLKCRKVSINDFYRALVCSNSHDIETGLAYLTYTQLKRRTNNT